jgi:hypothetical protein
MTAMPNLDEAVKLVEDATGFRADRPVAELNGWHYGERVRVIEDDDPNGVYADDEGYLVLEEVGSVELGNLRIAAGIVPDGQDCENDISLDNLEAVG